MRIKAILLVTFFALIMCILGCSGGQPMTPMIERDQGSTITTSNGQADLMESAQAFLGLYHISLDSKDMTWSIEPIRSAASADVLESVDISGFMTSSPCKDCVRIFNLGINSSGNLVMGLGIRHPFPEGDPSKEITGRNRADLHVFNVEGTLLTDSPEVIDFPSHGLEFATGYLINPDGYTTYLDSMYDNIVPTESEGHPYILHFDDYSQGNFDASNYNGFADVLNPTGNLVMKMGSEYSIKDYEFNIIPGDSLSFNFAVGCTYGFTTTSYLDRFNPIFRVPQHNKKAASEVHVFVSENNLQYWKLESSVHMSIEVMDFNHSAPTGSEKNQMAYESRVAYISISAPDISNPVTFNNPVSISGDGRNSPLVYEATIQNSKNAKHGKYPCLVKIKDSYPIRSNPNPYLAGADAMGRLDPTTMVLSYIFEFATYQMIELEVQPCDGVSLRQGVTANDIGVDNNGFTFVGYSDKQVWKYDVDFCAEESVYTDEVLQLDSIGRMDVHRDGRTILIGPAGNC